MIQVQNLGKSFGHLPVLRNVSFEAPDGSITGLLGANGAGKTTTLRMICGVLKPESVAIRVDDFPPPPARSSGSIGPARCSTTSASIRGSPSAKTCSTSEGYAECAGGPREARR